MNTGGRTARVGAARDAGVAAQRHDGRAPTTLITINHTLFFIRETCKLHCQTGHTQCARPDRSRLGPRDRSQSDTANHCPANHCQSLPTNHAKHSTNKSAGRSIPFCVQGSRDQKTVVCAGAIHDHGTSPGFRTCHYQDTGRYIASIILPAILGDDS